MLWPLYICVCVCTCVYEFALSLTTSPACRVILGSRFCKRQQLSLWGSRGQPSLSLSWAIFLNISRMNKSSLKWGDSSSAYWTNTTKQGPLFKNFLQPLVTYFHNKPEYLSLASFSSLVWWLWVRPGAYPRMEHLKGTSLSPLKHYSFVISANEQIS